MMDQDAAAAPPPLYINPETLSHNLFSKHDNRHSLQEYGVYLGHGLGKKHPSDTTRMQHMSDNHIDHGDQPSYTSTYTSMYTSDVLPIHSNFHVSKDLLNKHHSVTTKQNFHRFPRRYSLPPVEERERVKPSVNTMWWWWSIVRPSCTKSIPQSASAPCIRLPVSSRPISSVTVQPVPKSNSLPVLQSNSLPVLQSNSIKGTGMAIPRSTAIIQPASQLVSQSSSDISLPTSVQPVPRTTPSQLIQRQTSAPEKKSLFARNRGSHVTGNLIDSRVTRSTTRSASATAITY